MNNILENKLIGDENNIIFYTDEENDLTNLFLDIAETEAKEQKTITMSGWIEVTDDLLKYRKKNILKDAGKITHIIQY